MLISFVCSTFQVLYLRVRLTKDEGPCTGCALMVTVYKRPVQVKYAPSNDG